MTYPCGMIKDLLPLYIDEVCSEESKQAVESHLPQCKACRDYLDTMKAATDFSEISALEDAKIVDSLKNVKNKINKKIRNIVLCSVAAAVFFIGGYHLLFNAAIKEVPVEDVSVSAKVYSLEKLIETPASDVPASESVTIFSGEDDGSITLEVRVPELGTLNVTEEVLEKYDYISTVSLQSDYFLRSVKSEIVDGTMYISAIRTTLLNNHAVSFNKQICSLEFHEIKRIVYLDSNGEETLLWSN